MNPDHRGMNSFISLLLLLLLHLSQSVQSSGEADFPGCTEDAGSVRSGLGRPCQNGGQCRLAGRPSAGRFSPPRMQCRCPASFQGAFCENAVKDAGVSVVKPRPESALHAARVDVRVVDAVLPGQQENRLAAFQFRSDETSGRLLVLSLADSEQPGLMEVALLRPFSLQVTYELDSLEGVLETATLACAETSDWHRVEVFPAAVSCDGLTVALTNIKDLGVVNQSVRLDYTWIPAAQPPLFYGCFREAYTVSQQIWLAEPLMSVPGSGVLSGCHQTCSADKCQYGGQCVEFYDGDFHCNCFTSPYGGRYCTEDDAMYFSNDSYTFNIKTSRNEISTLEGIKFMFVPHMNSVYRNQAKIIPLLVLTSFQNQVLTIQLRDLQMIVTLSASQKVLVESGFNLFEKEVENRHLYAFRLEFRNSSKDSVHRELHLIRSDHDGREIKADRVVHSFVNPGRFLLKSVQLGDVQARFEGCIQNVGLLLRRLVSARVQLTRVVHLPQSPGSPSLQVNSQRPSRQCFYFRSALQTEAAGLQLKGFSSTGLTGVTSPVVVPTRMQNLLAAAVRRESTSAGLTWIFVGTVVLLGVLLIGGLGYALFSLFRICPSGSKKQLLKSGTVHATTTTAVAAGGGDSDDSNSSPGLNSDHVYCQTAPFKQAYWSSAVENLLASQNNSGYPSAPEESLLASVASSLDSNSSSSHQHTYRNLSPSVRSHSAFPSVTSTRHSHPANNRVIHFASPKEEDL